MLHRLPSVFSAPMLSHVPKSSAAAVCDTVAHSISSKKLTITFFIVTSYFIIAPSVVFTS